MYSVLIVDDNMMNRDILLRRLTKEGFSTSSAENGREALEMMEANQFDLILLDIMMPIMDGFETLENIRAMGSYTMVPVIMLTSMNEMKDVKKCIQLGANDYILKPYNLEELKKRIEGLLPS